MILVRRRTTIWKSNNTVDQYCFIPSTVLLEGELIEMQFHEYKILNEVLKHFDLNRNSKFDMHGTLIRYMK